MIDARGIACPQPVLMMKAELEKISEGIVTILVDNKGSSINVKNFCEANGCTVVVTEKDGSYQIDAAKGYACAAAEEPQKDKNIVVFISGECVGSEEQVLGKNLMKGFLGNLKNLTPLCRTIIIVNNGVRMTTVNEETVSILKELESLGVEILSCGACLNYFDIVDELKVGRVTDAHTVGTRLYEADKIIRF